MSDASKTKGQLIEELRLLRARVEELERGGSANRSVSASQDSPGGLVGEEGAPHGREHSGVLEAQAWERNLLQTVFDSLPDQIYVKDRESRFRLVNHAVLGRFGASAPDQVIGKADADFFPRNEAQGYLQEERRILETGDALINVERCIARPGKERAWALVTKVPLRDELTGEVIGLVGMNRDITRLKRAEAEMLAAEGQYRSVLDAITDAIHVIDRDFRIVMFNQAFLDWLSYYGLRGDPHGCFLREAVPFLPESSFDQYRRLFAGEEVPSYEFDVNIHGERLVIEVRRIPLTEGEQVVRVLTILRNVTERKRMEESLQVSEARTRQMVCSLPMTLFSFEADTNRILLVQGDVRRMFGCEHECLVQQEELEKRLVHQDDLARAREAFRVGLASMKPFDLEFRIHHAETGAIRYLHQYVVPVGDTGGRLHHHDTVVLDVTEQKQMEESLRASEARVRHMVNSLPMALFSFEAGTNRVLLVQGDVYRMLGYDEERFLTDLDLDEKLVHPDDLAGLREAFRIGVAPMQPFHVEFRICHGKTGAVRWMHQHVLPVADAEGRLTRMDSVVVDVTERKATEQALRESEARIRQMVDSLPIVLGSFEAETGRTLLLQGDTRGILGYDHEQIVADPHLGAAIVHPEDRAATYAAFEKGMALRRPFGMTYRIIHGRRGTPVYLQRYVVPVCDADNRLVRQDSLIIDVTAEREAQQRLKFLSQVVEQTSEGVAVADMSGKLLFLNGACAALHGGKVEDFLGQHLSVFHLAAHLPEVDAANRRVMAKEEFEGDIWHARKDGSVFPARMHSTLLRDESGAPVGLIGLMRDITALREMQSASARLAEAVKNAGEGIAIWDEQWSLIYANAAMCSILGWERFEDLSAREAFEYMRAEGPADPVDLRAALRRKGAWRGRMLGQRQDGSMIPLAVTFSRLRQEDGTALYVGNIHDMSREEAQLAQIRRLGQDAAAVLDKERARISKELHDELGQQLTAMNLGLAWIGSHLGEVEGPLRERLGEMQELRQRMTETVRGLARSLRPALLDYQGLGDALRSLATEYGHMGEITCRVKVMPANLVVENPLKTVIYRIAQEALTNVVRHANATRCSIEIARKSQSIRFRLCDDGSGSDPARLEGTESLGIIGMKERAAAVGGELRVENLPKGGVCVTAVFPRARAADAGE